MVKDIDMKKYYTYSELKESKLIYDKKPPAFGVVMVILTAIFIVAALLWACLSVKTYVVRAVGIVSDEKKVNIMNTVTGKIESIEVVEGQNVEEGDVILRIDSFQTELQIAQIEAITEMYQTKIDKVQMLIDFVNSFILADESTQKNPFEETDYEAAKMYSNAEYFITYVNQLINSEIEETPIGQEKIDELKSQFLVQMSVFDLLDEYMTSKIQQSTQAEMYRKSLGEYIVRAENNGVVHLTNGLTVGTVLSSSALIGNISSGEVSNLYIEVAVSATERSKLELGNMVEIAVSGVSQTEYGTIKGKIAEIDKDATSSDDGQVYYRVKINLDKTYLTDKSGKRVDLQNGMLGECRLKYAETTYMKWAIEQIVGKLK